MATAHTHRSPDRNCSILVVVVAALAGLALVTSPQTSRDASSPTPPARGDRLARLPVRVVRFPYASHDGKPSYALLLLPGWYGPKRHPAIPLVICPHGRNTTPEAAARRWFDLPTRGGFAVVLPAGQGRRLGLLSWGYPGQIADLARMPALVERAAREVSFRYLRGRVYAVGTSMGGQEALLLLARRPDLLAGVVAFDPATDLADRYVKFAEIPSGREEQRRARIEVGGVPADVPRSYRVRSPIAYASRLAVANVPVQLWWSTRDEVIVNQAEQAGRLYRAIKLVDPSAPVVEFVGTWRHAAVSWAYAKLPSALARIGLLPRTWLARNPLQTPRVRRAASAPVVA